MIVIETFQNLHELYRDPREFTHSWVDNCLIVFSNFVTNKLPIKSRQQKWIQIAIGSFLDGYSVFENPKQIFDFEIFSFASDNPVDVFGEYHENYHSAVKDLFIRAMQEIIRIAREEKCKEEEITPAIFSRMTIACCKVIGVKPSDAEKQFQWLQAAVWKENDRVPKAIRDQADNKPSGQADKKPRYKAPSCPHCKSDDTHVQSSPKYKRIIHCDACGKNFHVPK